MSTPKEIAHLLYTLYDLGFLLMTIHKPVYKAFETYFGKTFGSTTNKDNHFRNPDSKMVERLKSEIQTIKKSVGCF